MIDLSIFENKFQDIEFNEEEHRYRVKNASDDLISVTTLIGKYSNEFDSEKVAEKTAKKRGVSKESLLIEWAELAEEGGNKGSHLHKFIERYFLHGEEFKLDIYPDEKKYIMNFHKDFVVGKQIIYLEKVLYDLDYNIAGTIDALIYCPVENTLYFIDWKSNKEIKEENKWQKLKFPIHKYDQCSKEIYTLQISFYRWLIQKHILNNSENEIKCKNLLVHFSKNNPNYTIYDLPYYQFSVNQLLNHYNLKKD